MLDILEGGKSPAVDQQRPTPDRLETDLIAIEGMIGRLRMRQVEILKTLGQMEIHHVDGARSMHDWTAAKLDVSHDTSRALMTATKAAGLAAVLDEDASFDRAVATARLVTAGADEETLEWSKRIDIAGVRRLVSRRRRITPVSEREAHEQRHVMVRANSDESLYDVSGKLGQVAGRSLLKALFQKADEFPSVDGEAPSLGQRLADALAAIAQDSLEKYAPGPGGSMGVVSVFVEGALASETCGEAGGEIEYGPRIGPMALERILCGGHIRVIVQDAAGQPIAMSHATRQIPPAVRASVAKRDGGCTIDGCDSRYRLEPHHIHPWLNGGSHDPDNLTTLCWYHHHVAIHQNGRELDPESPPQRRRFLPVRRRGPPQE